jgi:hypothetical protein
MNKAAAAAITAVLLFAAIAAGIALRPKKETVKTAAAIRSGNVNLVCEDALWLYKTNREFISEKFAQLPESTEGDFAAMQKEFWDNATPSQNAITAWHNEVLLAIGERTRGNPEAERVFSNEIGEGMLRIYQTAMAAHIGIVEEESALNGIREGFCEK